MLLGSVGSEMTEGVREFHPMSWWFLLMQEILEVEIEDASQLDDSAANF